jgi:hypothetical protein
VDPVKYYVAAGERITTVGQPVSQVGRAKLAALQREIAKRGSAHPMLRGAAGALLYNAVVMAAFWLLLLFYRRQTYDKLREVVFFGALFSLVLLLTAGLDRAFPGRPELVPIPFAAIVVTLLYNGRIGVVAALVLAVLLDGQWALRGSPVLFFGLVGGVGGAVGIRVVRRRRHLYLTIGVMAAASVLASVTRGLILGWTTIMIAASAFLGVLMAPASASFAPSTITMASRLPEIKISMSLSGNWLWVGLITHWPSIRPIRTPTSGPLKGISETCRATEAPNIATTSGSFSRSADNTVAITWVSQRRPSANSGRMERSISLQVRISFSEGRPSRLENPPGIFPAANVLS